LVTSDKLDELSAFSEAGVNVQVVSAGSPEQLRLIALPNVAPTDGIEMVYIAGLPAGTDCVAGVTVIEKSDPLPFSVTEFVSRALEASTTEPARGPVTEGVNVTAKLQEVETAIVPEHELLLIEKSLETDAPLMSSTPGPALVSVTVCALVVLFKGSAAKVSAAGEKDTTGRIPIPLSGAVWGTDPAESLI
jgi:hypothetical protein